MQRTRARGAHGCGRVEGRSCSRGAPQTRAAAVPRGPRAGESAGHTPGAIYREFLEVGKRLYQGMQLVCGEGRMCPQEPGHRWGFLLMARTSAATLSAMAKRASGVLPNISAMVRMVPSPGSGPRWRSI